MSSAEKILQEIGILEKEAETLEKTAKDTRQEISAMWAGLIKLIRDGKTSTGDAIRDFVIVVYGHVNQKIEDKFRYLQEKIQAHPGEFILIVERRREQRGPHIRYFQGHGRLPPPGEEYETALSISLAIIKGPMAFDLKTGQCSFSTGGNYTFLEWWGKDPYLWGHDLCPYRFSQRDIGLYLNEPLQEDEEKNPALEIIIGDENVIAWIKKQQHRIIMGGGYDNLYILPFYKMCVLLGRVITFEEQASALKKEVAPLKAELKELGLKKQILNLQLKRVSQEKFQEDKGAKGRIKGDLQKVEKRISDILQEAAALGLDKEALCR